MMAPDIRQDNNFALVFEVEIQSFGDGKRNHRLVVAHFLWRALNRAFGADRVRVWSYLSSVEGGGRERILLAPDASEGGSVSAA